MAHLSEFTTMYYNHQKYQDINNLVCPPFNKIDAFRKKQLFDLDSYNFINLVLPDGEGDERYRNSIKRIFSWLLRDVMLIDSTPTMYIYEQEFQADGSVHTRYGVTALARLEENGTSFKMIEQYKSEHIDDRRKLLKENESQLESVMCLYRDPQNTIQTLLQSVVANKEALQEAKDQFDNLHRIYRIENSDIIQKIKSFFADKPSYLAEGAINYLSSLKYRKSLEGLPEVIDGSRPEDYFLATYFCIESAPLKTLPTNILIKDTELSGMAFLKSIEKKFKLGAMQFGDQRMEKAARIKLRKLLSDYQSKGIHALGVYHKDMPTKYFLLALDNTLYKNITQQIAGSELKKSQDVVLWEKAILQDSLNLDLQTESKVALVPGDNSAMEAVKAGFYDMALILNPIKALDVLKLADNNEVIPPLSANLYPGMLGGLVAFSNKYSKLKS